MTDKPYWKWTATDYAEFREELWRVNRGNHPDRMTAQERADRYRIAQFERLGVSA